MLKQITLIPTLFILFSTFILLVDYYYDPIHYLNDLYENPTLTLHNYCNHPIQFKFNDSSNITHNVILDSDTSFNITSDSIISSIELSVQDYTQDTYDIYDICEANIYWDMLLNMERKINHFFNPQDLR